MFISARRGINTVRFYCFCYISQIAGYVTDDLLRKFYLFKKSTIDLGKYMFANYTVNFTSYELSNIFLK